MRLRLLALVAALCVVCIGPAGSASAGTTSWTPLGLTGGDIAAFAIDPSNHLVVYAATYKGGVFKSTDGGAHWTAMNTGFTPGSYLEIYSLAIDPGSASTVYAGTAYG